MDKVIGNIHYLENRVLNQTEVSHLYNNVNWKAYTKKPEVLMQAIQNSLYVLSAWDEQTLVGLIRLIGDGCTIIYQRRGIGTTLIKMALEKYKHVRQKVLITDNEERTKTFYQTIGFKSVKEHNIVAFIKLV